MCYSFLTRHPRLTRLYDCPSPFVTTSAKQAIGEVVTTKQLPAPDKTSSPIKRNRGSSIEAGWQCSTCTYYNKKLASFSCEMCQSSRSLTALSPPAPTAISRHESEPSATLRQSEEERARSKWQRIVDFCRKNGDKFVDDSFPPVAKSLHSSSHEGVQWLRPTQIVSSAASHVK